MPHGSKAAAAAGVQQQPAPFLQRLLVLHLNLPTLCTGQDLDETASDEEVAESVLYYSRTVPMRDGDGVETEEGSGESTDACRRDLQECVRFAGLCQALFRLPSALECDGPTEGRETQEVHLGRSLLVFEMLEAPHVVAVAQVSRQQAPSPRAVRTALRRSHQMFCLFRGGGIRYRIGDYGRMRVLYELHRRRRSPPIVMPEFDGPGKARRSNDVEDLRLSLPITSLREDLNIHYDTLLEDFAISAAEGKGVGRGIVECLPTPITFPSGTCSSNVVPAPVLSSLTNSMNAKVKEFLIDQAQRGDAAARVVAASMFERGTLSGTVVATSTSVPDESAVLLYTHMSTLRAKMSSSLDGGVSGLPPTNRGYTPLSVTFGKDMVQDATTNATSVPCRFMAPPPLALLSASDDETHDFQGPIEGTRVWAPRVSLPQRTGTPEDVRVILYEADLFAFVLYIDCPPCDEGVDKMDTVLSECLRSFDEMATSALTPAVHDQLPTGIPESLHSIAGQDVVVVRHRNFAMTLLRSPNYEKNNESTNPASQQNGRLRFFRSKFYTERSELPPQQGDRALDPRYQLASSLSSEALAAFEDALLDVRKVKAFGSDEQEVEACTLLPSKWMYAFSDGEHELFVFLDPAIYVTVNDVQHAAEKIRSDLIETRRVESL